jgi:hypothetical protein
MRNFVKADSLMQDASHRAADDVREALVAWILSTK